jgi:radical SAM superfamily enzyme YgiQ (UPF0313 family)
MNMEKIPGNSDKRSQEEGKHQYDACLFFPPLNLQFKFPELGIPQLTSYLRKSGRKVRQKDLNIEFIRTFAGQKKVSGLIRSRLKKERHIMDELGSFEKEEIDFILKNNIDNVLESFTGRKEQDMIAIYNMIIGIRTRTYQLRDIMETICKDQELYDLFYEQYIQPKVKDCRVVGFSVMSDEQLVPTLFFSRRIKEDFPGKTVCIGGAWCTASLGSIKNWPEIFRFIDYVVFYNGEKALEKIIQVSRQDQDLDLIGNIAFLDDDKVMINRIDHEIDLGSLPPPDFDGFPLGLYPKMVLPYQTTINCEWGRCRFCHHRFPGIGCLSKEPETVVSHIAHLKEKYRISNFFFADLSTPKELMGKIAESLMKKEISISWKALTRADKPYTSGFAMRLKSSGCEELQIGLETSSKKSLEKLQKGINPKQLLKNLRFIAAAGIKTIVFVLNYPGQEVDELRNTVEFLMQNHGHVDYFPVQRFVLARPLVTDDLLDDFGIIKDQKWETDLASLDLPFKAKEGIPSAKFKSICIEAEERFQKEKKKKKVLLINPPAILIGPLERDWQKAGLSGKTYPDHGMGAFTLMEPVGLLKLATYLDRQNCDVTFIDCIADESQKDVIEQRIRTRKPLRYQECGNFQKEGIRKPVYWRGMPEEEFRERIKGTGPDEIMITSVFTYEYEPLHTIISICKEIYPKVPLTLGGIYATLCPQHAKKAGADRVYTGIRYDVDQCRTALELLDYTPERVVVKFSRGCIHRCSFCAVPAIEGSRVDNKDYLRVADEIEEKAIRHGIRKIDLWESNILHDAKNRFYKLVEELRKRKLDDIEFFLPEGIQPSLVTEELAVRLRSANFKRVILAGESSSDSITSRIGKPSRWKSVIHAVHNLKSAGYDSFRDIIMFIMAGLPYQTRDDIIKSISDTWKLACRVEMNPYTPIPRTRDFEDYHELIKDKDLADLHPMLWPFAGEDMPVSFLEDILFCKEKSSFFQLRIGKGRGIEDQKTIDRFKDQFRESKIVITKDNIDKICEDPGFMLIDLRLRQEDITRDLIVRLYQALLKRIKDNHHFYMTRPVPPCLLRFSKEVYIRHIPRDCDHCFYDDCKIKGINPVPGKICSGCGWYNKKKCRACFFER